MSVNYDEGQILLINKPIQWTSFDVVKKLRNTLRIKKIGHAGTLDPLATGLLVIGTGRYTKKLNELQGLDKTYTGVIEVGKTTPSYDLETPFDTAQEWGHVMPKDIEEARRALTGDILQVPPAHSAVKINGVRAYKKARAQKEVHIEPRAVRIYSFHVSSENLPEVDFEVSCSKGTYIRSLAHDFGEKIGVGAYLKKLVRTRIGEYRLEDAYELADFIKAHHENN